MQEYVAQERRLALRCVPWGWQNQLILASITLLMVGNCSYIRESNFAYSYSRHLWHFHGGDCGNRAGSGPQGYRVRRRSVSADEQATQCPGD